MMFKILKRFWADEKTLRNIRKQQEKRPPKVSDGKLYPVLKRLQELEKRHKS